MSAGEKGIGAIVAVGICVALALTVCGVGAVAATSGVIIGDEVVHITIDQVRDYVDENDIDVENMTMMESVALCVDVAKANM